MHQASYFKLGIQLSQSAQWKNVQQTWALFDTSVSNELLNWVGIFQSYSLSDKQWVSLPAGLDSALMMFSW